MIELIAAITLLFSSLGIIAILLRKIPLLVELPKTSKRPFSFESLFFRLRGRIQNTSFLKPFEFEIFLQKILSKIRILILRIENRINTWLQELRQRSLQKRNNFSDGYWKKIKRVRRKRTKTNKNKT